MAKYLNTRGNTYLGIGICGRCSRKFPIGELYSDPNGRPTISCCPSFGLTRRSAQTQMALLLRTTITS